MKICKTIKSSKIKLNKNKNLTKLVLEKKIENIRINILSKK